MKKALTLILLSSLLIMQSCVLYGKKDALSLSTTIKQKTELDSALTSVNVSNNLVTIQGSGFSNVTTVKLTGTSLNADLKIDSKSDSQIIASATSALSLLVGETFNLIIGTADAQVTYTVTFTLQNGAIQLSHLSSLGATTAGQILKFNGTSWAPAFLAASQNYLGTWNATTYLPDITTLGSFNPGDYYIVDTSGTYTSSVLTTSPTTFAVGNWVMFNGSTWDKVLNGNLSGSGTANYIPYYSSSNVLANSPMSVSGSSIGIGTATPGSSLDVKGTLRLSGATSGFVGLAPAAVAGGTTYTLPAADGTNGQVLTTNASGVLSWTSVSVSGGTVTGVTSANADIGVASGTTAPVLTLNSGTSADQIVKLTAAAKLPAVDGSLLTNLASTSLVGAVAVANGGTGATTLGASQSALGITLAGPLTGNVPTLGATVIADRLCASDSSGGTISCINNLPAATVRGSVSGTSGTGNLLFATSPTISSPVITNIAPAADFTLTQNAVVPFTSVNTGAVANTLYLSAGKVGIGTTTPASILTVGSGQVEAPVGSTASPSYSFSGDLNTGIFNQTSDTIGFAVGGVLAGRFNGGGLSIDTGVLRTQALGSAASPVYTFITDPNTGIFGGGTDVLGLTTGGTERMRIDASGNVGIGTTSPASKLHVGVAPTASANYGLVSLGSGAFDGSTSGYFGTSSSSNSSGTVLALNAALGYVGDLVNFQVGGSSKFKVDASGNTTVGGSLNVAGQTELSSQSASSTTSVMTRELGLKEQLFSLSVLRQIIVKSGDLYTSGSGSNNINDNSGISIASGTTASAWQRAHLIRALNSNPGASGGANYVNMPFAIAITGHFYVENVAGTAELVIISGDAGLSAVPPAPGANKIAGRGFGVRIYSTGAQVEAKLFAHDGSSYSESAAVAFPIGYSIMSNIIISTSGTGTIKLFASHGSGSAGGTRTSTTPLLTLTGGPSGANVYAGHYVSLITVNGATPPTSQSQAKVLNALLHTGVAY